MQSLYLIENFLGFHSTREHNASIYQNVLDTAVAISAANVHKLLKRTSIIFIFIKTRRFCCESLTQGQVNPIVLYLGVERLLQVFIHVFPFV